MLRPGDTAVISTQVEKELLQNASLAKDSKPYPAHPFPIVPNVRDLGTEMALGARLDHDDPGFQGDIIIGTTAIKLGRILVASDQDLVEVVMRIGGLAVWVP